MSRPKVVASTSWPAGLSALDTAMRRSARVLPLKLPAVLGLEGCGTVEAVGDTVSRFRPGDEVFFFRPAFGACTGSYAEYAVVPEVCLAAKPASINIFCMSGDNFFQVFMLIK